MNPIDDIKQKMAGLAESMRKAGWELDAAEAERREAYRRYSAAREKWHGLYDAHKTYAAILEDLERSNDQPGT